MKIIILLSVILIGGTTSGCFVYERRAPHRTVVVTERRPVIQETVVNTLPRGYRSRVYRGIPYYYSRDVVYRPCPAGGYVIVQRPW